VNGVVGQCCCCVAFGRWWLLRDRQGRGVVNGRGLLFLGSSYPDRESMMQSKKRGSSN
jgi:hypothetical protein